MQLICPYCGHAIPAADINLERMVAKCAWCSAVFGFEDQIAAAPARALRLDVPLPKGMLAEQQGYELAITRRWLSPKFFFLVFFLEQEIERFLIINGTPVVGELAK